MMRLAAVCLLGVAITFAQLASECEEDSLSQFYKTCCFGENYINVDVCAALPGLYRPQNELCQSEFATSCTQSARVQEQANEREFEANFDECLADKIIMETDRGEADISGNWRFTTAGTGFRGDTFINNNFRTSSRQFVRFNAKFLAGGVYDVYVSYGRSNINSQRVPITIVYKDGVDQVVIDQTKAPTSADPIEGEWNFIGQYRFQGRRAEYIEIGTEGAGNNRLVSADAVRFDRVPCTTTVVPTTEEPETTEEVTTTEMVTLQPREDCLYECKVAAASCRNLCGPRSVSNFLCRVNCKLIQNECDEECAVLPATPEPTDESGAGSSSTGDNSGLSSSSSTTRSSAPVTTTRASAPVTTTTRASAPVTTTTRASAPVTTTTAAASTTSNSNCLPRTCRCKAGARVYSFINAEGCQDCSCRRADDPIFDSETTTTAAPAPVTTTTAAPAPVTTTTAAPAPPSSTTTTAAGPTTESTRPESTTTRSTTTTTESSACPAVRECRCKPGSFVFNGIDSNGCEFCSCKAGDAPVTTTTAAPAPVTTTTAAPAPPVTTTTAAPAPVTTTAAACPAPRVCRCKPGSYSEEFINAQGCADCSCKRL